MNLHTIFLPTQQNADSAFGRFVLDAFDLAAASTAYNMYRIIAQDMCKKALNTRPLPSEATPTFIAQSLRKDASHECLDEVLHTHLGGATAEERIIYITRVLCGFAFYTPSIKNSLRLQVEDDIEEEARILAVKIFAAYMGRSQSAGRLLSRLGSSSAAGAAASAAFSAAALATSLFATSVSSCFATAENIPEQATRPGHLQGNGFLGLDAALHLLLHPKRRSCCR